MLAVIFAVHLNRSLVELVGLVIKKTEVAYSKSLPCVVVKVTCGFGRFQIQKMKVILFRRVPSSSRRQDIDDFTVCTTRRIKSWCWVESWFRLNSWCRERKEVSGHGKVALSRFQTPIGELASLYHRVFQTSLSIEYSKTSGKFVQPCSGK